jgi:hypothetical protein
VRRRIRLVVAAGIAGVVVAAVVGVVAARPATAEPSYSKTCNTSGCHTGTPVGSVSAIPDTATPAPGATYHVAISVGLGASGNAGYRLYNDNAATPAADLTGGPASQTSWNPAMTAPSAAGTYTYRVWGAKGAPTSGQSKSTTYTITVSSPSPAPDKTAPTTGASGAAANGWYNHTVALTLTATDNAGGSGVKSITYSIDGAANVVTNGSTAHPTIDATAGQGPHTITYHATDNSSNVESGKTLTLNIDTVQPATLAPASATVKAGKVAKLKYQVNDTGLNAGTATVTIKIENKARKVVKTIKLAGKPVNTALKATFKAKLKRGTYKFFVSATDKAGNVQANIASNKLKVK